MSILAGKKGRKGTVLSPCTVPARTGSGARPRNEATSGRNGQVPTGSSCEESLEVRPRRDSGFTLVELAVVLVVLGVLTAIAIPNYIQLVNRTKDSKVKENCHCVQVAVEAFAVGTNGIYPDATDAAIVANILPEFPGGQRLVNPFTNVRTEPIAGAAVTPGQTGYQVNAPFGINIGYTVTGFGKLQLVLTRIGGE